MPAVGRPGGASHPHAHRQLDYATRRLLAERIQHPQGTREGAGLDNSGDPVTIRRPRQKAVEQIGTVSQAGIDRRAVAGHERDARRVRLSRRRGPRFDVGNQIRTWRPHRRVRRTRGRQASLAAGTDVDNG